MAEHITRTAFQTAATLGLVIVAVLGGGCATSAVRSTDPRRPCSRDDASAFYPATMQDFAVMDLAGSPTHVEIGPTGSGDTCIFAPVFLIEGLLDLPFSLLTDTLWLPADISRYRRMKRIEEANEVQRENSATFFADFLQNGGDIPSPDLITSNYVPAYCDTMIGEYVSNTNVDVSEEKIEAMVNAGVALPVLARSPHLDIPLARSLILKATSTGQGASVLRFLADNLQTSPLILASLSDTNRLAELFSTNGVDRETMATLQKTTTGLNVRHSLASNPNTPQECLRALGESDFDLGYAVLLNPSANVETMTHVGLKLVEPFEETATRSRSSFAPARAFGRNDILKLLQRVSLPLPVLEAFAESKFYLQRVGPELAKHPRANETVHQAVVRQGDLSEVWNVVQLAAATPSTLKAALQRCDIELARSDLSARRRQSWENVHKMATRKLPSYGKETETHTP